MNNQIKYQFGTKAWEDGFRGTLKVTNGGESVDSWQAVFESEFAINQHDGEYEILGAEVVSEEELTDGQYRYVIEPLTYNEVLAPQESIFIPFNSTWSGSEIPELGNIIFNTQKELPVVGIESELSTESEFDIDVQINTWSFNSGATVLLDIINIGDKEIHDGIIKFNSDFKIRELPTDIWGAEIVSETPVDKGYEYVLNFTSDENLALGEEYSLGFNTQDDSPEIYNIMIKCGTSDMEPEFEPLPEPIPCPCSLELDVSMGSTSEVSELSFDSELNSLDPLISEDMLGIDPIEDI